MSKWRKDSLKLRIFRVLYYFFAYHFKVKWATYFKNKLYDQVDYEYGPSDSAEFFARQTGYWNLFAANQFATSDCGYSKEEKRYIQVKEIIPLSTIYKHFEVRKY